MLLHLHIRNFAIVPTLEQEFLPGFTAISGETGAGKSILVDALGLLLGARSDASWVRDGAERAELNAEFGVAANTPARNWLREHDLEDGEGCLLRRSIQANGRSRAWVNGTPVTIGQLAELGHCLVEVHGQNEHVRLATPARQLAVLDRTGDHRASLDAVERAHAAWQSAEAEYREFADRAALPPAEVEFLGFQLEELENEELAPEAIEALEREHRLLASGGALVEALERCDTLLEDDDSGAARRLAATRSALQPFADLDPSIGEARAMLEEALINVREAAATLSAVASRSELDPDRLQAVENRLSRLGDLARKHGVDLERLASVRDRLVERLDSAAHFDEARDALEARRRECLEDYRARALALSEARRKQAKILAGQVQDAMQDLGMAGGVFEIKLNHDPEGAPAPRGTDRVELRVSANPGIAPAPLSKVASGGELSRISLAIKVATADSAARTQVFDEVDTGVGGDTANAVGKLLQTVSRQGQVLCVTHLAQVAVRADQQLKVSKAARGQSTAVDAGVLDGDERVEEIARMLGGTVSAQSRAHAREMLQSAIATLQ